MVPHQSTMADEDRLVTVARVLALGCASLFMLAAAWTNSVTDVESAHLPAGLAALRGGSLGVYGVCGPASKLLYALPAYLAGVRVEFPEGFDQDPRRRPEWAIGSLFEKSEGARYLNLYRWSRLLPILVTLLGGWLICEWSSCLFGAWAGVGALCTWCFTPLVLGHGSLVTSDAISAATLLFAARTFWAFLVRPSLGAAGLAGLALGLAQATKFTLLVLYPCWTALVVLRIMLDTSATADQAHTSIPGRLKTVLLTILLLSISVFMLDALYLFQGIGVWPGRWGFVESTTFDSIAQALECPELGWLGRIPLPIPMEYLRGLDLQIADAEREQAAYLLGASRMGGWWYWYPAAAFFKVPLPALALAGLGLARLPSAVKGDDGRFWAAWCILLPAAEAAIAISASTGTGTNAAIRYMIPTFALVCAWIGCAWNWRSRLVQSIASALVAWCALDALGGAPDQFAWQNELGWAWERSTGAPALIGDAVDWGQDALRLSRWVGRHAHEGSTLVEINGKGRGATYGLEPPLAKPIDECWNKSTYLAVSKNPLFGFHGGTRLSMGAVGSILNRELASRLSRLKPCARVGRSILIYRIADIEIAGRGAHGLEPD